MVPGPPAIDVFVRVRATLDWIDETMATLESDAYAGRR
jgi:hypothetical protein